MRIGIDIDGVLRDFARRVLTVHAARFPGHRQVKYEDWEYSIDENFPDTPDMWKLIYRDHMRDVFEEAEVLPGALEGFKKLQKTKHDVVIVTKQQSHAIQYSLTWLGVNGFNPKEIHVTSDKSTAKVDILLDDHIVNLERVAEFGTLPVAMTQPWNKLWTGEKVSNMMEFCDKYGN